MKEITASMSRTWLALVGASALLLAYACLPGDTRAYEAAQIEATALESVVMAFSLDVDLSERSLTPGMADIIQYESERVRRVATEFAGRFGIGTLHRHLYLGPLSYPLPGYNSTVSEILRDLHTAPVRYVHAPTDVTLRHAFDIVTRRDKSSPTPLCVQPGTNPSSSFPCDKLPLNMELSRVYVEDGSEQPRRVPQVQLSEESVKVSHDWVLLLEFVPLPTNTDQASKRIIYAIKIGHLDTTIATDTFGPAQLKNALSSIALLSRVRQNVLSRAVDELPHLLYRLHLTRFDATSYENDFPHLRRFMSDVGSMTTSQAASYFNDKGREARQKFSLLGQTLDERLFSIGGPLFILSISLFLLSEAKMLNSALARRRITDNGDFSSSELSPCWIGLDKNGVSRLMTASSIAWLPVIAICAIWTQTDGQFDVGQTTTLVMALATAAIGVMSLIELRRLRCALDGAYEVRKLKRRGERRAAVREKLRTRKAKRAAPSPFDDIC
ncbi:hypothetical protein [Paraburkholderia sp. RL17-337-BIB-A]|uniref:hypothetical protein n=1 Tax=Paraburkholderia sp. RL17-337-BIB-A TaxID=3031636 RepID=UPI0038BC14EF